MKNMREERGSVNALLIPVVLLSLLCITSFVFAVWAFGGRQTYKNDSDAKVAAAVAANKVIVQASDAKTYAEAAKNPLKTYVGPDAYGSIHVTYPKSWDAYVDTTNSGMPLDSYFHTDYVPSIASKSTYNLRVQVVADAYSSELAQYTSLIQTGKITAIPYAFPKVPSITGVELTGQIFSDDSTASGTMVVVPLRDKTLKVWTESATYLPDFTTYILPNLSFSP